MRNAFDRMSVSYRERLPPYIGHEKNQNLKSQVFWKCVEFVKATILFWPHIFTCLLQTSVHCLLCCAHPPLEYIHKPKTPYKMQHWFTLHNQDSTLPIVSAECIPTSQRKRSIRIPRSFAIDSVDVYVILSKRNEELCVCGERNSQVLAKRGSMPAVRRSCPTLSSFVGNPNS